VRSQLVKFPVVLHILQAAAVVVQQIQLPVREVLVVLLQAAQLMQR
jgi:hypothetical protein